MFARVIVLTRIMSSAGGGWFCSAQERVSNASLLQLFLGVCRSPTGVKRPSLLTQTLQAKSGDASWE